jgi:hypothetical protein
LKKTKGEKTMKKLLIILMVIAMVSFIFAGCAPPTTPAEDEEVEEETEAEEELVPTDTPTIISISGIDITSDLTQYVNSSEAENGITVEGTAATGAEVKVYIGGTAVAATAVVTATGIWSIVITESELGDDGEKTVYAVASEVGLADATSTSYDFTLDTDAPGISSIACTANLEAVEASSATTEITSHEYSYDHFIDALSLSGTPGQTVVEGDYVLLALGPYATSNNVKITNPAGDSTTYDLVDSVYSVGECEHSVFVDVIPGISITFGSFVTDDTCTITNTAAVSAVAAIAGRATMTFDEDITSAGAMAGTYAGGLVSADPFYCDEATDTVYWTDLTTTEGDTVSITVYGITDLAGNVSGTSDVPLAKSCIVGAASATALKP